MSKCDCLQDLIICLLFYSFAGTALTCESNPCMHGGTCSQDEILGYMCHCDPNFTGLFCETPYDGRYINLMDLDALGVLTLSCTNQSVQLQSVARIDQGNQFTEH